jgi:uncharacterized phage protein gp47/JayE
MSGSQTATLTVASPPTTAEVTVEALTWIAAQSGVLTDFNPGSQVRTDAEAVGSVIEMQSVIGQAEAFQAMVYSAWAAFNVMPLAATSSIGSVSFLTGTGANPPVAPLDITIPSGTVVQTVGGTQFQTLTNTTLPKGSTSVTAVVSAVVAGTAGNVPAGAISQIASALPYPLQVTNAAPTVGGTLAETPAQTMTRFAAVVGSIGLATPVAIANGCIGVSVAGSSEAVQYATVYEPWITQADAGLTTLTPGFQVFVDNGSGSASSNLLLAVQAVLDGNQATGQEGFRPAGVPYSVHAVDPLYCNVVVSGQALYPGLDASLNATTTTAVGNYFSSLAFGQPAEATQLTAAVANAVAGNINTLSVILSNVSGVSVSQIVPTGTQRAILKQLVAAFS